MADVYNFLTAKIICSKASDLSTRGVYFNSQLWHKLSYSSSFPSGFLSTFHDNISYCAMTTSFYIISNSLFTVIRCLQYLVWHSDIVMKEHIHLVDKYQCFGQRCCLDLPPWRWGQHIPLKCIYLSGYELSCISRLIINIPGYENLKSFDTLLLWIRPPILLDFTGFCLPWKQKKSYFWDGGKNEPYFLTWWWWW